MLTPTQNARDNIFDVIPEIEDWFAEPAKVELIMAPFTPSPLLDLSTLVVATFSGSTLRTASGNWTWSYNPDGSRALRSPEPAGGWVWTVGATTNLPQTIYGYRVKSGTALNMLGAALLVGGPVLLTISGQTIDIGAVEFAQLNNFLGS